MKILGTVLVVAALLVAAFAAYYFSLEYRNESRIIERGEERASEAVRKAEAATGDDKLYLAERANQELEFVRREKDLQSSIRLQLLGMGGAALALAAVGVWLRRRDRRRRVTAV